jgi:exonuclease VII large subunit
MLTVVRENERNLFEMMEKLMNKVEECQRENRERIEQLSNNMGQRIKKLANSKGQRVERLQSKVEKLSVALVENRTETINSMRIMSSDLEKRFNDRVDKTERDLETISEKSESYMQL